MSFGKGFGHEFTLKWPGVNSSVDGGGKSLSRRKTDLRTRSDESGGFRESERELTDFGRFWGCMATSASEGFCRKSPIRARKSGDYACRQARRDASRRGRWWRRGESNPRPKAGPRGFYECSRSLISWAVLFDGRRSHQPWLVSDGSPQGGGGRLSRICFTPRRSLPTRNRTETPRY